MKIINYSEWEDTNITFHMLMQMMGKTKLEKMPKQPEWNQSLLYITDEGFTTGLIPDGINSFEIKISFINGLVEAKCTSGLKAGFNLGEEISVAIVYDKYLKMLDHIKHSVSLNPVPQEVFFTTPFNEQNDIVQMDYNSSRTYFRNCLLARNSLLKFASSFRGKKILPAMFWGTFDLTTVLFSGVEKPFPGKGVIEEVAFNEQFVEFGFWPGDRNVDESMFFILPYPFLEQEMDTTNVTPKEAIYSAEKAEYFLSLKDALKYDNPDEVIADFCKTAFEEIIKKENWSDVEWLLKDTPM